MRLWHLQMPGDLKLESQTVVGWAGRELDSSTMRQRKPKSKFFLNFAPAIRLLFLGPAPHSHTLKDTAVTSRVQQNAATGLIISQAHLTQCLVSLAGPTCHLPASQPAVGPQICGCLLPSVSGLKDQNLLERSKTKNLSCHFLGFLEGATRDHTQVNLNWLPCTDLTLMKDEVLRRMEGRVAC